MTMLFGIISVLLFLVGIVALIRPIPELKINTRPRALLVIVASFALSLGTAFSIEKDSDDVSAKAELTQGVGKSVAEYELVSRADYVGGVGIKVRVPMGLSTEKIRQIISDAADKYGGSEEVTVWVYRENDDVNVSGYTVAMGERSANDVEFKLVFSDDYFEGASNAHDAPKPEQSY